VRRSRNSTSFSPPWARAWDGHEVVDLAVGRLALRYAEENPDEVLAALDDKTEAVIRELSIQRTLPCRTLNLRVLGSIPRRLTIQYISHLQVGDRVSRCCWS
jgi:hypothetical protein